MSYLGNSPGVASQRIVTTFTATSGQTTFTPTSGYSLGYLDVFLNGVKLINVTDYTATNGTSVILVNGVQLGDSVELVAYIPRGFLVDSYSKDEADTKYVTFNGTQTLSNKTIAGATISGNLVPNTNIAYDLGTSTYRFRDLYLSGSTIDLGGATMKTDSTTGTIALVGKPTVSNPNPTALIITQEGKTLPVSTTAGAVNFTTVATQIQSNPGFSGSYTDLLNKPTTSDITEGTNLYFTNTRARTAISFATGSGAYNSSTGLINIPTNNNELTNGAGYITGITSANVTTALGYTPESSANKAQANGYASLDATGKIPSSQLPSYVDDVLEYANQAALPVSGETGKIYVTLDNNKVYRWSGSSYLEIVASPNSTDSVAEGSTNLYFTNARARSAISVTGSGSYNSSTGVITISGGVTSVNGNTGDITGLATLAGPTFTGTVTIPTLSVASSINMSNTTNGIYCHYFGTVTNGNITVYNAYNNTDPRIIFYGGTGSNLTYHTANLALYPGTSLGLDLGMSGNRWNNVYAANANLSGTLTESSSVVYKENIQPITNALELVTQLTGVTYDRIDGSAKNRAGLIKEAVEQVLPNIVRGDGIQYTNIIAYLVESIKELKREIDVLRGV